MFEMTAAERAEGAKSWYFRRLRSVRKNRSVGSLLGAFVASVFASSIATGPACSSSGSSVPSSKPTKGAGGSTHRSSDAGAAVAVDGAADAGPFEPISPAVYVAKVKNILVGLPPTDDEVNSVTADPSKLAGLIDGWMTLPQYEEKMNYHQQTDSTFSAQKGLFAFEGVQKSLSSVADLADVLTSHPLFGPAWAQKLCYYVNSKACDPSDPELARIVADWKSSGYAWNTLVRELLSSPLTTGAAPTLTTREGLTVAVSRRDHICTALNERLGFKDVCALDVTTTATAAQKAIAPIVAGLPSDGYGRGSVAPVLPNEPTLFYRAGMENICATVSALVIDTPAKSQLSNVKQWSSKDPDSAIADFVSTILALTPSDPRSQPMTNALKSHYTQAMGQGATATNALRSTFVVACLSPSALSIGL